MTGEKVDRFDLQLEHFQKSLERLKEALAQDENSFIRDSIIKRFEVTFEMAWKTVYRYFLDRGERLAPTAWEVIPKAFQYTLVEDAELWNEMRAFRNDTSHEYNEAKAVEIAAFVRAGGVQALDKLAQEMKRRA